MGDPFDDWLRHRVTAHLVSRAVSQRLAVRPGRRVAVWEALEALALDRREFPDALGRRNGYLAASVRMTGIAAHGPKRGRHTARVPSVVFARERDGVDQRAALVAVERSSDIEASCGIRLIRHRSGRVAIRIGATRPDRVRYLDQAVWQAAIAESVAARFGGIFVASFADRRNIPRHATGVK